MLRSLAAALALTFTFTSIAHADDAPAAPASAAPTATTPAPTTAEVPTTTATTATTAAAKVDDTKSPWSALGLVGGGLIGLGMGVSAVSTVVLVTESKTTITLYRYIELGVGSAEIATGITLVVIDGLTE